MDATSRRGRGTTFPRLERVQPADRVLGRLGLTGAMRTAARAVAETLFTTAQGPPPAERLDWVVDELDDFLKHSGERARLVFRLCLLGIETTAPALIGKPPPFHRLSAADRTRALEAMERNAAVGLAVFGAKAPLCILYYEHPDAAEAVGFEGQCLSEARGGAT